MIDFTIKEFCGAEFQKGEPDVNVPECFDLYFKDYKNNEICLSLDYDTILDLIRCIRESVEND